MYVLCSICSCIAIPNSQIKLVCNAWYIFQKRGFSSEKRLMQIAKVGISGVQRRNMKMVFNISALGFRLHNEH